MADTVVPWSGNEGEPIPTRYLFYGTQQNTGRQMQIPAIGHTQEEARKAVELRYPHVKIERVARAKKQFVGWKP